MINLKTVPKTNWIKFSIAALLFVLWVIWIGNYWILLGLPIIFDLYITKVIPWGAWKKPKKGKSKPPAWKEWLDALVFALVAVYIINIFFFQNYKIPTSSLEKTLLVGDHLFVSKMSYGPRMPFTPLSFPLVQNTFPIVNSKSYFEKPQWDYRRLAGFGDVERDDIVVFNFPAGDTVPFLRTNPAYFNIKREIGLNRLGRNGTPVKGETEYQRRLKIRAAGAEYIKQNPDDFGEVLYRPVDRRDNYVKRCVAIPGDTFEIRHNQIFINGEAVDTPEGVQHNYHVVTDGTSLNRRFYDRLGISKDDSYEGGMGPHYILPLTQQMAEKIKVMPFIESVNIDEITPDSSRLNVFPYSKYFNWSRDNYGPMVIPAKGATAEISIQNILLYERIIRNYEGNTLTVDNGNVLINGKVANSYTFKMDYYFMMGDNRHKSADSRYWGFVPEDHVVGKPVLVWLSLNKDKSFPMNIRWDRFFKYAGE